MSVRWREDRWHQRRGDAGTVGIPGRHLLSVIFLDDYLVIFDLKDKLSLGY